MTPAEVATAYQACIDLLAAQLAASMRARLDLDDWERELRVYEAELLLNGAAEGRNAEERAARLLTASTESEECRSLRAAIVEAKQSLADAERQITVAKEQARLYRLLLALSSREALQELVA
jgi:hypothetical protein